MCSVPIETTFEVSEEVFHSYSEERGELGMGEEEEEEIVSGGLCLL